MHVAFGFCEYADPECTLRAMRLLNGFKLGDKNLVVSGGEVNREGFGVVGSRRHVCSRISGQSGF